MTAARQELIDSLRRGDVSDSVFRDLVDRSLVVLKLGNDKAAEAFDTSIRTVGRWRAGINAPHPAMRPRIYKILMTLLEKRL